MPEATANGWAAGWGAVEWTLAAAGVAAVLVVLADLAFRVFAVRVARPFFEREPPFALTPEPPDPAAETHRVPVPGVTRADGGPLELAVAVTGPSAAWRTRHGETPRGIILFCPETGGSRWHAKRYAAALPDAGVAVVSFAHRGTGDSDAAPGPAANHWPGEPEVADARAVLDWAAARPAFAGLPAGVFGVSRGGCVALAVAARDRRVKAAAADGAFLTDSIITDFATKWAAYAVPSWLARLIPRWHIAGTMRLTRWWTGRRTGRRYLALQHDLPELAGRPVWLVSGKRDSYVSPDQTRAVAGKLGVAPWIVRGAKHNEARRVAGGEYDDRLTAFFAAVMPAPPRLAEPPPTRAVSASHPEAEGRTAQDRSPALSARG